MPFIDKNDNVTINVKLTTAARKLLASGNLTFGSWVLGDSEIDYKYVADTQIDPSEFVIQRPLDRNPQIKYPVYPTDSSSTPNNLISAIVPVEVRVRNTAKERGFFSGNTINGFSAFTSSAYVIQDKLKIDLSTITGGTSIAIKQDSGFVFVSEPLLNDFVYINWINPNYTGSTSQGVLLSSSPTPQLWYQIQSKTGTIAGDNLVVTFDRNLPNFNGSGSGSVKCLVYPGGDAINTFYGSGETTSYWNDNTLAFNSNCNIANDDVAVWNMNIVYTEDIAGKQIGYETFGGFGSSGYTGFKNYLSLTYDKPTQKSIGIIHYSNHSINNYYGEEFYNNTPVLELPSVIWYNATGNTMGLTLRCDTSVQVSIPGSGATDLNTYYYNLVDDNGFVVGKCFIDMKIFVIEDEELIAAMSYKSNRNWAYPSLISGANTSGIVGTRPNVFTTVNQKLYVTYLFESESSGYTASSNYGYTTGLHCQNYTEYVPQLNGAVLNNNQVPQFALDEGDLQYLADNTSIATGVGLTFNKFKVLYQLVSNQSTRPDPAAWKEFDYTNRLSGYPWSNGPIPASAFAGQIYTIDNNIIGSGTTYDVNSYVTIPTTSQFTNLQFGDETFFFGNVKTEIEATVFKTKLILTLPYNQFNTSTNPTWVDSGSSVYVSEIGIYDNNNVLVAVGKLSYPFEKKSSQTRIVEVSIDF